MAVSGEDQFDPLVEFEKQRGAYDQFCARFHTLFKELLDGHSVAPLYTECRVKDAVSLEKKLYQREERIEDWPQLHSLGDLAGVRAIFLYRADVERAAAVLDPEFAVCQYKAKHWDLDPDKFGYTTWQWTVRLDEDRAKRTEWSGHGEKQVEIQLRTLLQHAWAVHSHPSDYKPLGLRPKPIRRRLFRLAALLETGDAELVGLVEDVAELRDQYRRKLKKRQFGAIELNGDSLTLYLEDPKSLDGVIDMLGANGYDSTVEGRSGDVEKFLGYATICGLTSLKDFRVLVRSLGQRLAVLREIAEEASKRGLQRAPAALPLDALVFLLVLNHEQAAARVRRRSERDFEGRLTEAVLAVRDAYAGRSQLGERNDRLKS